MGACEIMTRGNQKKQGPVNPKEASRSFCKVLVPSFQLCMATLQRRTRATDVRECAAEQGNGGVEGQHAKPSRRVEKIWGACETTKAPKLGTRTAAVAAALAAVLHACFTPKAQVAWVGCKGGYVCFSSGFASVIGSRNQ